MTIRGYVIILYTFIIRYVLNSIDVPAANKMLFVIFPKAAAPKRISRFNTYRCMLIVLICFRLDGIKIVARENRDIDNHLNIIIIIALCHRDAIITTMIDNAMCVRCNTKILIACSYSSPMCIVYIIIAVVSKINTHVEFQIRYTTAPNTKQVHT